MIANRGKHSGGYGLMKTLEGFKLKQGKKKLIFIYSVDSTSPMVPVYK